MLFLLSIWFFFLLYLLLFLLFLLFYIIIIVLTILTHHNIISSPFFLNPSPFPFLLLFLFSSLSSTSSSLLSILSLSLVKRFKTFSFDLPHTEFKIALRLMWEINIIDNTSNETNIYLPKIKETIIDFWEYLHKAKYFKARDIDIQLFPS